MIRRWWERRTPYDLLWLLPWTWLWAITGWISKMWERRHQA